MVNRPSDFYNELVRTFGQDFTGLKGETYTPSDDAYNDSAELEIERRCSARVYVARQADILAAEAGEEEFDQYEDDYFCDEEECDCDEQDKLCVLYITDLASSYREDTEEDYIREYIA